MPDLDFGRVWGTRPKAPGFPTLKFTHSIECGAAVCQQASPGSAGRKDEIDLFHIGFGTPRILYSYRFSEAGDLKDAPSQLASLKKQNAWPFDWILMDAAWSLKEPRSRAWLAGP